ncbi:hypothetical protein CIG19_13855 [Enterobacterales bacterium CwR94]|nr:hypothetical protein CIG19_13855 [Enterobacterales bacterium CwR94]
MKKLFIILFSLGWLLLGLTGYLGYTSYQYQKQATYTTGIITDVHISQRTTSSSSDSWFPDVAFRDSMGKLHVFRSSIGSSSYKNSTGSAVEVIYHEDDIANARVHSFAANYFTSIICVPFALALLIIGGVGIKLVGQGSKFRDLVRTGKPLTARITDVERNESVSINGRSPWRIVCQWSNAENNKIHVFKSANFYYDPTDYIQGDTMTVYVDHNNFKKYYVDISGFPQKA